MWNKVSKPGVQTYTNVNADGKQQYDDTNVLYDDPNVFYDGVNPAQWNEVPKPTTPTWSKVSKPT